MPSLLFHVAIAAFIGLAVLGDEFDQKALIAVLFAGALPDLDALLSIWFPGAHRTYLHNVFVFLVPAALLYAAGMQRWFRQRVTPQNMRILWTCILVVAVAGIGLDVFGSGTNLFFPVHDQFYHFAGDVQYSNQRGLQQTLFDVHRSRIGSTQEVYYASGFDPQPGPDSRTAERRFPLFGNGIQLLLSVTAFGIIWYRMRERRSDLLEAGIPVNAAVLQTGPLRSMKKRQS